jgi:hypothetical protein
MKSKERAESIIKDILVNHLPRIEEGLKQGYVDENQILVMYDHAVRARILIEQNADFEELLKINERMRVENIRLKPDVLAFSEMLKTIKPELANPQPLAK